MAGLVLRGIVVAAAERIGLSALWGGARAAAVGAARAGAVEGAEAVAANATRAAAAESAQTAAVAASRTIATETVETAAASGAKSVAGATVQTGAKSSLLNRYLWGSGTPRIVVFGGAATWIGYGLADKASGGAISMAAAKKVASGIASLYKSATATLSDAQKREWISKRINDVQNFKDIVSLKVFSQLGVNTAVAAQASKGPEAMKEAAIAAQFADPVAMVSKLTLRGLLLTQIEPGKSQQERNVMLAQGFIDDLIKGSECSELSKAGVKVTQADIEKIIAKHAGDINKLPCADSLRAGLVGVFPDLAGKLDTGNENDPSVAPAMGTPVGDPLSSSAPSAGGATGIENLRRLRDRAASKIKTLDLSSHFQQVAAKVEDGTVQLDFFEGIGFALCQMFGFEAGALWFIKDDVEQAVKNGKLKMSDLGFNEAASGNAGGEDASEEAENDNLPEAANDADDPALAL